MNRKASRRIIARTIARKLLEEPKSRQHWITALAAYLVETHRSKEVDLVVNDIARELFEQRGELLVDVTSARPLTDQLRTELKNILKSETGAGKINVSETIDASLLGGLIARTPDAKLDLSVRRKLQQLAMIK